VHVKRCSQLRLMRLRQVCNIVQFCVHNCDCDCNATTTRNKHVHFTARLHEGASNHSAVIGVGMVDQLWHHCLLLFSRVSVVNEGNLLFAVIFLFNYIDFIHYGT